MALGPALPAAALRGDAQQPAAAASPSTVLRSATSATASWSTGRLVDQATTAPTALSCATTSFCVAVDGAGNKVTFDSKAWSQPRNLFVVKSLPCSRDCAAPGFATVQCPATNWCLAVTHQNQDYVDDHGMWRKGAAGGPHGGPTAALSCPSTSFCMALGSGTYSEFNGATWTPNRPFAPGSYGSGSVSCTSAKFCVAIESNGSATIFDGASWGAPVAIGATTVSCAGAGECVALSGGNEATLTGRSWSGPRRLGWDAAHLSCPAVGFCAATSPGGEVRTMHGSSWSVPSRSNRLARASTVACVAPGWCLEVGLQLSGRMVTAAQFKTTLWTVARDVYRDGGGISAVACVAARTCEALAAYPGGSFHERSGRWSGYSRFPRGLLSPRLACPSNGLCVMVGSTGGTGDHGFASLRRHGKWSARAAVDSAPLTDLACASESFCIAVDDAGHAVRFDGSVWSKPVEVDGRAQLAAVSCPASGTCGALDLSGKVEWLRAGGWSAPSRTAITSGADLSCASATSCVAVSTHGVVERLSKGRWSVVRRIAAPPTAFGETYRMSCASSTYCVVTTKYDGRAFVLTGTSLSSKGTTLTAGALTPPSCPAVSWCSVGDSAGRVYVLSAK
jgi:hypothetical protein